MNLEFAQFYEKITDHLMQGDGAGVLYHKKSRTEQADPIQTHGLGHVYYSPTVIYFGFDLKILLKYSNCNYMLDIDCAYPLRPKRHQIPFSSLSEAVYSEHLATILSEIFDPSETRAELNLFQTPDENPITT